MKPCKLAKSPIVYYISGNDHAESVLFLHAAFVNHHMFDAQAFYFQDQYNVLTLDLLGHGDSTDTQKGDSIANMSVWIHEILDHEHIQKVHLVGVSLGAVLAQDFADRYPEAVQSLACFGGYDIHHFDAALQKGNHAAQSKIMRKAIFSVKAFAEANKKISAYTPEAQDAFFAMNLTFPKKSFRYLASLHTLINARQSVPRPYPLLIGCGEHDIPMELTAVEQWKVHEPQSQMVIFPGAGHCVNLDVPEQFHQTLAKFWENKGR